MMAIRLRQFVAMLAFSGLMAGCAHRSLTVTQTAAAGLEGHWRGDAHVVVAWAKAKTISIDLEIRRDASATGQVGDAQLRNARVVEGQDFTQRLLNIGPRYIVVGQLEGDLIKQQQIHRSGVNIIIDRASGTLEGGIHTTGLWFGGKDSMVLSACNMVLKRVPATGLE